MEEANLPYAKRLKLSEPMVKYCTYLMDKYGEDYKVGHTVHLCNLLWQNREQVVKAQLPEVCCTVAGINTTNTLQKHSTIQSFNSGSDTT